MLSTRGESAVPAKRPIYAVELLCSMRFFSRVANEIATGQILAVFYAGENLGDAFQLKSRAGFKGGGCSRRRRQLLSMILLMIAS